MKMDNRSGRFFLRIAIPSLVVFSAFAGAQQAPPHWSYAGKEGPRDWGHIAPAYSECSLGHAQSPINIQGTKVEDLPPLRFDYHPAPLDIIDNGHTVQVNYAPGNTLTVGGATYTLKQFHFHHPSEEHVNGHRYDMVAHLVHTDASGHTAVVAVLFTVGQPNALLETLWKHLPAEKGREDDVAGVTVDLERLLPADLGYYTFAGSLTTPPCSEGVTWYVLKTPVTLSAEQLAIFARLYPSDARPIQPKNGREILESR